MSKIPSALIPRYPAAFVREYIRILLTVIRQWQQQTLALVDSALNEFRDGWTDDLFKKIQSVWEQKSEELQQNISGFFARMSERHKQWWLSALGAATGAPAGLLLSMMRERWAQDEQSARVTANIALVSTVVGGAAAAVSQLIREGVRSGLPQVEITRNIKGRFAQMERQALYIGRNQTEQHWAAINQLRQQEAGVVSYVWLETSSRHPRKDHLERVGKEFYWSSPPPGGHPGSEPNCKCGAAPVIPKEIWGIPVKTFYAA
jgi:SPP1 gp7 family putative phage head morphogenesis protein